MIPVTIENGICKNPERAKVCVEASEVNTVKITMTKTSSTDAPAVIHGSIGRIYFQEFIDVKINVW